MKKLLLTTAFLAVALAAAAQSLSHMPARHTPSWFSEGFTYQLVPRNFTPEGTLKAAEAQLERLKELGCMVVYLYPVNVADTDMDRSKWSPRQIKSGFNDPRNPYRAKDYFHVDPEYGTDQDLKDFVDHAHSIGLKVILDMVFAHCGPGAQVLKQHPEYFKHDKDGNIMTTMWNFPMLDFDYVGTRTYFCSVLSYYIADYNVDGFRIDVADRVPFNIWEEARGYLDRFNREILLIAEGKAYRNTLYAFDANYGKKMGRLVRVRDSVKDKGGAIAIRKFHEDYFANAPKGSLVWSMTENHDTSTDDFENRTEKTEGHAHQEFGLAFNFAIDGVPFIFNGQEICFDRRVSLFGHKDCWIDWNVDSKPDYAVDRSEKIRKWSQMRREYSSLAHGETIWLDNDCPEQVISFLRRDGISKDVLFVGNYSENPVKVKLSTGKKFTLDPWGYFFGEN